ncbi:uncharacterized protein [Drosophila bipectinata]|uniref:uncharacterized protein n=1 Tax=Drosophila bipectinata TaxID=42026 RepID=UPI001C897218|nr:GPI-anchored hemophore cfmA [Drosophila bipectinata]
MDQTRVPQTTNTPEMVPEISNTQNTFPGLLQPPEVCDSSLQAKKMAEEIAKRVLSNMITSQECMQLKRDLEVEHVNELEISPAILCLILTFLVFVTAFWVWLISRSCVFHQADNGRTDKRLQGGQMSGTGSGSESRSGSWSGSGSGKGSGSKSTTGPRPGIRSGSKTGSVSRYGSGCSATRCEGYFLGGPGRCRAGSTGRLRNSSSDKMFGAAVPSRPWRSCPISLCRQEPSPIHSQAFTKTSNAEFSPTTDLESPVATSPTKTESLTQEAPRSSQETFFKPEIRYSSCGAEAGSPSSSYQLCSYTCSEKGFPVPTKKYRVQWSRFLKLGQKEKLDS